MTQPKQMYEVYYQGRFFDETVAVSEDKAINNVRWNRFLSIGLWADWDDFEAIPERELSYEKEKKNNVSLRKAPESTVKTESAEEPDEQVRWVQLSFL